MVNCVKGCLADEINGKMWDTSLVLKFQPMWKHFSNVIYNGFPFKSPVNCMTLNGCGIISRYIIYAILYKLIHDCKFTQLLSDH